VIIIQPESIGHLAEYLLHECNPGWPVSRILSGGEISAWAAISLGRASPHGSCSLPGTQRRRAASRLAALSLLGLAPTWGCLAARITARAGGLLHRLFTLAAESVWGCPRWFVSVALVRRVTPPRALPGRVLYGVRTFLDATFVAPRSPGQPEL